MENLKKWLIFEEKYYNIRFKLQAELKPFDLEINDFYVLYFLSQELSKELRLNKLQDKINLSQSALSRLIQRMESKDCGVIERTSCSHDKRGIYIHLTNKGEELLQKVMMNVSSLLDNKI